MGTIRNVDAIYDTEGNPILQRGEVSPASVGESNTGTRRPWGSWLAGSSYDYNSVQEMKDDLALSVGDVVTTIGYTLPGVGANKYRIAEAGTGTEDGGKYIDLPASGLQAVGLFPDGKLWVSQWGCLGDYDHTTDTGTDNTQMLQAANDYAKGLVLHYDVGTFMITDTVRTYAASMYIGGGAGNTWGIYRDTGPLRYGTRIKLSPTEGTKRIWTDVGQLGSPAGLLTDAAISVGWVWGGASITARGMSFEGGQDDEGSDAWDVICHTTGIERSTFTDIETTGHARITGWYEDSTWSNINTALLDLHQNTYGWTIDSGGSNNEIQYQDCWFNGGNWGFYRKGTIRTDTSARVWAYGGDSDVNHYGCRFGNRAIKVNGAYPFNSGAYYRDLHEGYQNRYYFGCSFRAQTGTSFYLDRGRHEYFFGMYGEQRPDRLDTEEVILQVGSPGVVKKTFSGNWEGGQAVEYYVYLSNTERLDVLEEGLAINVTLTTDTGSCTVEAYGYDSSAGLAYVLTHSISGSITSGQSLTQAAGQDAGLYFYATDRAQFMFTQGSSAIACAAQGEVQFIGGGFIGLTGNVRTEGLETTGTTATLGSRDFSIFECEAAQLNLWVNRLGTGSGPESRLRMTGTSFDAYYEENLGSAGRRWDTLYCTTAPNVSSDRRIKQDIQDVSEAELAVGRNLKVRKYRKKAAVEAKGDSARWHFGFIVDEVETAFKEAGLDPYDYGAVCYDKWDAEYEESEDGSLVITREAGDLYSLRYDELYSLMLAAKVS